MAEKYTEIYTFRPSWLKSILKSGTLFSRRRSVAEKYTFMHEHSHEDSELCEREYFHENSGFFYIYGVLMRISYFGVS